MTINETADTLIKHSICIKNMATCGKECSSCSMAVQDQKLLEAYDMALEALAMCGGIESYQKYLEKVS